LSSQKWTQQTRLQHPLKKGREKKQYIEISTPTNNLGIQATPIS